MRAHEVVVLVLERRRVPADFDAVALEILGQVLGPENGDIGLGRRAEIGQRMQHAVAALRHQRPSIEVHAADALGRPIGVAAEQSVVVGCAQEAHDAKLLNELIPKLLGAGLVQRAFLQVALDVDVEEARDAANRHGRAVGFLHRAKIGEIGPLHGLLGVGGRAGDVIAIELRHRSQIFEGADLLGELLACPDDLVGRPHVVDLRPLGGLGFKQTRGAVKSDATVIADDPPTTVCVRKAGDDAGPSAAHDLGRVGVEDTVIVRLAIFRERFVDPRVGLEAGRLQARLDHAQPAIRENGALERLIGLQPDDHLVVTIDIPSLVRQQS